jgi:hypothetical protein
MMFEHRPPQCAYFEQAAPHIGGVTCTASAIFDGLCPWHCDMRYGLAWYGPVNEGAKGLTALGRAESPEPETQPTVSYQEWRSRGL